MFAKYGCSKYEKSKQTLNAMSVVRTQYARRLCALSAPLTRFSNFLRAVLRI